MSALLTQIIVGLAGAAFGWLSKVVHGWMTARGNEKEAESSVQPLKDAKTGGDIDKASDDALSGF